MPWDARVVMVSNDWKLELPVSAIMAAGIAVGVFYDVDPSSDGAVRIVNVPNGSRRHGVRIGLEHDGVIRTRLRPLRRYGWNPPLPSKGETTTVRVLADASGLVICPVEAPKPARVKPPKLPAPDLQRINDEYVATHNVAIIDWRYPATNRPYLTVVRKPA